MSHRAMHLCDDPSRSRLFASDYNGVVHQLDRELRSIRKSDPFPGRIYACYVAKCDGEHVYARDLYGNLAQWRADDLALLHVRYLRSYSSARVRRAASPIPTVSHGLHVHAGRVLVNNPYGELLEFDAVDLSFRRKVDVDFGSFIECVSTERPGPTLISDCTGYLWWGDLEKGEFTRKLRLDYGPVHCIQYDRQYDRYWMTTDNHHGFSVVSADGSRIQRLQCTNDDCEWISLTPDGRHAFVGCFDHHVHVFENAYPEPKYLRKLGPFKFQVKQVLARSLDEVYVLLESGEIFRVDAAGRIRATSATGTNCVWDLVVDPAAPRRVFAPLEDGGMCAVEFEQRAEGQYDLKLSARVGDFGFGRMRRLVPLGDGSFVAGCSDGSVFRFDEAGQVAWRVDTGGIVRDLAVHAGDAVVAAVNEAGVVLELDLETGAERWRRTFATPLWAVCYRGDELLFSDRTFSPEDQDAEASAHSAGLYRLDRRTQQVIRKIEYAGNVKRIRVLENGHVLLVGNGDISTVEMDLESGKPLRTWWQWQLNTCEDAAFVGDRVYTVTYGYQLNTYAASGEILDSQLSPDDYPKAVLPVRGQAGEPLLLVAGRGAFVSLYALEDGVPEVAATLYVPPRGSPPAEENRPCAS